MSAILEHVKLAGAVRVLEDHIDSLAQQLRISTWDSIHETGRYAQVQRAIQKSREIIDQIEEADRELSAARQALAKST